MRLSLAAIIVGNSGFSTGLVNSKNNKMILKVRENNGNVDY